VDLNLISLVITTASQCVKNLVLSALCRELQGTLPTAEMM